MSVDETNPIASPESDISPKSQTTPRKNDYFSLEKKEQPDAAGHADGNTCTPKVSGENKQNVTFEVGSQARETDNTGDASATTPGETTSSSGSSAPNSRKGSLGNVTFLAPNNPSLPRGQKKPHGGSRIRDASPPYRRLVDYFGHCVVIASSSCVPLPSSPCSSCIHL